MANYQIVVLLLALTAGACRALELNGPCTDGDHAQGVCVPIKECDLIVALLRRGNFTDADREYLKKADCGLHEGYRLVCCPLPRNKGDHSSRTVHLEPMQVELPPVGKCGIQLDDRIFGGQIANIEAFPWLARIMYYKPGNRFGFHCGGVLIHERYVLTAAHCIQSVPSSWSVFKVRLGEFDTESDVECKPNEPDEECVTSVADYLISTYYIHEDYTQENGADYDDIALLRLTEDVEFTDYIRPICLPMTAALQNLPTTDIVMTVAGWGQTENSTSSRYKMFVGVKGWPNEKCNDAFKSLDVEIRANHLCAGGTHREDSCRGDSGGPLMKSEIIDKKPVWILKGIVSFGPNKCGTKDIPGVYTRISNFFDWIEENIQE